MNGLHDDTLVGLNSLPACLSIYYWKNTGYIISDVSWVYQVFWVGLNIIPSARQSSRQWSDLDPSSRGPLGHPLQPEPPRPGPQLAQDSAEKLVPKAPTFHLNQLTVGNPGLSPPLLHQLLVLGTFMLLGFIHALFPGHNKLQHDHLFGGVAKVGYVWTQWCWGEVQLLAQLPISFWGKEANVLDCWGCFSPAFTKLILLGHCYLLAVIVEATFYATALSTCSCCQQ